MAVDSGKNSRERGADRFFRRLTGGRGRPAAAVLLVALALCYILFGAAGWEPARRGVFDAWQRMFPRKVHRFPVVIVDIDEMSLKALGRWPWPRTRLAELTEAARRLGAEAVGYDIIMPEADSLSPDVILSQRPDVGPRIRKALEKLPSNDEILAETLRKTPSVVARAALIDAGTSPANDAPQTPVMVVGDFDPARVTDYRGDLTNIEILEKAAFGCGYLNDTRDPDGVVRSMPLVISVRGKPAPALSLELLRTALGAGWYGIHADKKGGVQGIQVGEAFIPTDRDGRIRLYFSPAYAARRVSALSVLSGKVAPGAFAHQVAIIGVTAVGAIDVAATPVAARMDGVEIQAQVVENILSRSRLIRPVHAAWIALGVFLAFGLALVVFLPKVNPGLGVAIFAGASLVLFAASVLAFHRFRILLDPSFPVAGCIPLLLVLLTAGFADARARQRALDAALEAEKLERMRIVGELAAAREIQMGMLPSPESIDRLVSGLDFYALLEPAEEVGGDLYDAFMIDDRRFFFMVGDVAGKGVAASLFMALCKTLTKSTALKGGMAIDTLFTALNEEISRQNPAMLFVTAIAGIIDVTSGRVQMCSAGHEAPLLLHPGRLPAPVTFDAGPPLCVLEDFPYRAFKIVLEPGDMLVMISDGITEAHNEAQELYGRQRIADFLARVPQPGSGAEEICRGIFSDVRRFAGGAGQSDDITVMAVGFRTGG